jgi:hypothetical protein
MEQQHTKYKGDDNEVSKCLHYAVDALYPEYMGIYDFVLSAKNKQILEVFTTAQYLLKSLQKGN